MGQTLIVLAIVVLALGYLGSRVYRTARSAADKDAACGAGCGCEAPMKTRQHA